MEASLGLRLIGIGLYQQDFAPGALNLGLPDAILAPAQKIDHPVHRAQSGLGLAGCGVRRRQWQNHPRDGAQNFFRCPGQLLTERNSLPGASLPDQQHGPKYKGKSQEIGIDSRLLDQGRSPLDELRDRIHLAALKVQQSGIEQRNCVEMRRSLSAQNQRLLAPFPSLVREAEVP